METIIEKSEEVNRPDGFFKVSPSSINTNGSMKYDSTVEFLLLIRNKAKTLLIIGFVSFFITFFIIGFYNHYYHSTVVFMFDDTNPEDIATSESERMVLSQINAINKNRMYLLIFSDEMVNLLEQELKISEHYKINKNTTDYPDNLIRTMKERVLVQRIGINTVSIVVKDKNKFFAPKFANTIYKNLLKLNKESVLNNLNYKLKVYEKNVVYFQDKKNEDADKFMHAINQLPALDNSSIKNREEMYILKRDLSNMIGEYNKSAADLKKNEMVYNLTSGLMKDTTLQSLYLINQAYPDPTTIVYMKNMFISLGIAVCITIYCFLIIYLVKRYNPYIQILYKKDLPRFHH